MSSGANTYVNLQEIVILFFLNSNLVKLLGNVCSGEEYSVSITNTQIIHRETIVLWMLSVLNEKIEF